MAAAIMTKKCLPSDAVRRIAQALLNAYAAPAYTPPALGLRFDDIESVAPGLASVLGLTAEALDSIDAATQARLVSGLAARMLD